MSDPAIWADVIEEFVRAGAPEEILYVSKPHIGTFRLVTMVMFIREEIERLGGEYRFETRVDGFDMEGEGTERRLRGLRLSTGETLPAERVILAVGHSARDTFEMLRDADVAMDAKPFSIGVRIEHPSLSLIQPVSAHTPGTICWVPLITSWFITRRMAGLCIRSACARADRSWRQRLKSDRS